MRCIGGPVRSLMCLIMVNETPVPSNGSVMLLNRGLGHEEETARVRGKVVTWLILPVVICLSQRLSHACLSINKFVL